MRPHPRRPVVTGRRFSVFEPPAPPPPWTPGDLPDGVLDGLPFAALDPDLPLLLLPVRLETRYALDADPPELRIRILPDQAQVVTRAGADAGHPVLLPGQWLAIGFAGGQQVFQHAGLPVASGLRTGPDPAAPTWEVSASGLVVDDGLAWMVDYDRAVAAGMAITVPLTGTAAAARAGLDALLVVGVDPGAGAATVRRLLDAHARAGALSFVAQGTPTNQTASAAAGWVPAAGDAGDDVDRLADALGLGASGRWRSVTAGTGGEQARSRSMRQALYEAVLGTMVRRLLQVGDRDALGEAALNELRRWFVHHVTGGAPLPTLRVGQQPYGVLPVRRSVAEPDPGTTAGQVERLVGLLIDVWRESAAGVPTLDPGGDNLEAAVATVLAGLPHPARLFARPITAFADLNGIEALLTPQSAYEAQLEAITAAATGPYQQGTTEVGIVYADQLASAGDPDSIDAQIDLWDAVHDAVENQFLGDTRARALDIVDAVRGLLWGFEHRQRPVRWIGLDRYEGRLDEDDTKLVGAVYQQEATEWGDAPLVAASGQSAADYLAGLRDRLGGAPAPAPPDPEPLLYQLLDRTLDLLPAGAVDEVRAALHDLAALDDGTLEWLLRETLGLGTHRLDAWATSLASERLDRLRGARPEGVQVGGFGWVTDLAPRAADATSSGFVHAPSLAHAATAALLRSGWEAHGSDDPASAGAVDLRSSRMRSALWLLDGVRAGQPPGDLLGYGFERALHDLGADAQIRPVRKLVLAAAGTPGAAPDRPVDGIALLELDRAGGLSGAGTAVRAALDRLADAFDSVSDAALFEGVHQLAAGNHERATAILDAVALGERPPPELRGPLTPRAGTAIEHRVLVLLDPSAPPPGGGWAAGLRDAVAPGLEAWVASLLPAPSAVGFTVSSAAGRTAPLTLADLGLSALDAIALTGDDPAVATAALRTLAAGRAGWGVPVTVDTAGAGQVSLREFGVLARELRQAVESLRPAGAADVRPGAAAETAGGDASAALDAIEALVTRIDLLRDRLDDALEAGDGAAVAAAAGTLARLGIATGAAPADLAAGTALEGLADARMAAVTAIAVDRADREPGLTARLAVLLGRGLPVLRRFALDGAVALDPALAAPADVDDWLDAVGRVRPAIGRLATAGMLSELLSPSGGLRAVAGQSPRVAGEPWVAMGPAAPGAGGRLSVVAVTQPGARPAGEVTGLVVDRWAERIPAPDQVTGLAVQFDAPASRPPQSWLLAVTPDRERWSLELVVDTLLETMEWATLRAVCPEDMVDYGRAIPTVFAPGRVAP